MADAPLPPPPTHTDGDTSKTGAVHQCVHGPDVAGDLGNLQPTPRPGHPLSVWLVIGMKPALIALRLQIICFAIVTSRHYEYNILSVAGRSTENI